MHRLHNPMRHYAWGSVTAIPAFLGAEPDGRPVAEMWMGAHPSAPSRLEHAHGAPLNAEIAAHPETLLGPEVLERYGARLPFLLKMLAADKSLSLQAHLLGQTEDLADRVPGGAVLLEPGQEFAGRCQQVDRTAELRERLEILWSAKPRPTPPPCPGARSHARRGRWCSRAA